MRVDANDTLPMMRATAPTPRFETLDTSCCEENVDAQIGTESSYILDNATVPLSPVVFRGGSDTSDMSDRLSDTDDGMSPDIYMEDSTGISKTSSSPLIASVYSYRKSRAYNWKDIEQTPYLKKVVLSSRY